MNPLQINVGEVGKLTANKDIEQKIIMCTDNEKLEKLSEILTELTNERKNEKADEENEKKFGNNQSWSADGKLHDKIIVFVAKKISCHDLSNKLWDDGFAVDSLHGDRPQWERTKVMQAFKNGTLRALIATDVAARGLDVKDVGVVVNFDMPAGINGIEDYVHRIGRTGRAGKKGKAITFFASGDKKAATGLVQVLQTAEQKNIPQELLAMARPRGFGRGGRGRGRQPYIAGRSGGRGYMSRGFGGGGRGYYGGGRGRGYGRRGDFGRGWGGR